MGHYVGKLLLNAWEEGKGRGKPNKAKVEIFQCLEDAQEGYLGTLYTILATFL